MNSQWQQPRLQPNICRIQIRCVASLAGLFDVLNVSGEILIYLAMFFVVFSRLPIVTAGRVIGHSLFLPNHLRVLQVLTKFRGEGLLEKLIVAQQFKVFPSINELKSPLLCSQEPITGPYLEPNEYSTCTQAIFL
jgi:hypothetical protein